jgi:hypothetical protein
LTGEVHDDDDEAVRYALGELFGVVVLEGAKSVPSVLVGDDHFYTSIPKPTASHILTQRWSVITTTMS